MDTNKMREQFESFAREVLDWSDDEFRLASDGKSYYWGATGEAWVFWQASRDAVVVELPELRSVPDRDCWARTNGLGFNNALKESRQMIEAQGLKVEVAP